MTREDYIEQIRIHDIDHEYEEETFEKWPISGVRILAKKLKRDANEAAYQAVIEEAEYAALRPAWGPPWAQEWE